MAKLNLNDPATIYKFRDFVSSKYPQMNANQLKSLNSFVDNKTKELETKTKYIESTTPQLQGGDVTTASKYKSALDDLMKVSNLLRPTTGTTEDILTGTTGPLAQVKGQTFGTEEEKQARQELSRLRANIRKEYYGGALTATEIKSGIGWIVGPEKQESANKRALEGLISKKNTELVNFLRTKGFGEEDIGNYLVSGKMPTTQEKISGKPSELPTSTIPKPLPMTGSYIPSSEETTDLGISPGVRSAAVLQKLLGEKEILPLAGAAVAQRIPIPYLNTGLGSGGGEYLKQLLQPGETIQEKGLKGLIPSGKETGEIVKTGAGYAAADYVLGKLLGLVGTGLKVGGGKAVQGLKTIWGKISPGVREQAIVSELKTTQQQLNPFYENPTPLQTKDLLTMAGDKMGGKIGTKEGQQVLDTIAQNLESVESGSAGQVPAGKTLDLLINQWNNLAYPKRNPSGAQKNLANRWKEANSAIHEFLVGERGTIPEAGPVLSKATALHSLLGEGPGVLEKGVSEAGRTIPRAIGYGLSYKIMDPIFRLLGLGR